MANLFLISATPILKVILLCLTGAAATRAGFLDAVGRKQLSLLVFYIFAPALLFIKLCAAITFEHLVRWSPIVLLTWLGIVVGLAVANALGKFLEFPKILRPVAMAAISMANTGNLPLVIVTSLAADPNSPFAGLEGLGVAYVALAMLSQSTVFFSIGYTLMKKPTARPRTLDSAPSLTAVSNKEGGENTPLLVVVGSSQLERETAEPLPSTSTPAPSSQPAPLEIEGPAPSSSTEADSAKQDRSAPPAGPPPPSAASRPPEDEIYVPGVLELLRNIKAKDVFTPPNIGSFAALFIGCVPFLKSLLFSADPTKLAPLDFITSTISILADACVPAMMIVLGSILANGPGAAKLSPKILAGIVFGKLVAVPLVGILVVLLLLKMGFSPPDPFYTLIVLLNFAMPTAINLQTLAVLNGHMELEVSAMMFYQYVAAAFTLPFFIFLSLVITT